MPGQFDRLNPAGLTPEFVRGKTDRQPSLLAMVQSVQLRTAIAGTLAPP
jgi:hypothetical protein